MLSLKTCIALWEKGFPQENADDYYSEDGNHIGLSKSYAIPCLETLFEEVIKISHHTISLYYNKATLTWTAEENHGFGLTVSNPDGSEAMAGLWLKMKD